jgi:hypothetical protein
MNSYSWKKEAREPTSDRDPTGNQTSQEKTNLHVLPPGPPMEILDFLQLSKYSEPDMTAQKSRSPEDGCK